MEFHEQTKGFSSCKLSLQSPKKSVEESLHLGLAQDVIMWRSRGDDPLPKWGLLLLKSIKKSRTFKRLIKKLIMIVDRWKNLAYGCYLAFLTLFI